MLLWTVLRPIGWCGEKARLPRRKRGGDWEVVTVECHGPCPRGEDPPTSNHSPLRWGYKTERSWVEPGSGVRRDVEVVSGLASESQDQREGTAASGPTCLEHANDERRWIGEREGEITRSAKCEA